MSLDVFVSTDPDFLKGRRNAPYRHVCSLDDDGYYWFMEAWFRRLRDETGEYIDLYGAAVFGDQKLATLANALTQIGDKIFSYPTQWKVVTGEMTKPEVRILSETVFKTKLQALLATLNEAVKEAKAQNAFLVFFGD